MSEYEKVHPGTLIEGDQVIIVRGIARVLRWLKWVLIDMHVPRAGEGLNWDGNFTGPK